MIPWLSMAKKIKEYNESTRFGWTTIFEQSFTSIFQEHNKNYELHIKKNIFLLIKIVINKKTSYWAKLVFN